MSVMTLKLFRDIVVLVNNLFHVYGMHAFWNGTLINDTSKQKLNGLKSCTMRSLR